MAPQDVQVILKTSEANRLAKWASLWFDLLHVDVALDDRFDTPDKPSTAFTRRALWESAVVSYGRMEASNKKQKLEHEDLLRAAGGDKAMELHAEIMRWRNEHVAHRLSREFETASVYAQYPSGEADRPDGVSLSVSTWAGPKDDAPLAIEFREHVKRLRDTLWTRFLAPTGESIAQRDRATSLPEAASRPDSDSDDVQRMTVNLILWSRTKGTGV